MERITANDIRRIPDGVEIDRLVAERVMECKVDDFENKEWGNYNPSTNILQAYEVVNHLRSKGFDFECRTLHIPSGGWGAIFHDFTDFEICVAGGVGYAHKVHDIDASWEWPATAFSLPSAICRAALLIGLRKEIKE